MDEGEDHDCWICTARKRMMRMITVTIEAKNMSSVSFKIFFCEKCYQESAVNAPRAHINVEIAYRIHYNDNFS